MTLFKKSKGTGYIPDIPDSKDRLLHKSTLDLGKEEPVTFSNEPKYIISESDFTPIRNQGSLGSCTAHAGVALMEYYIKKRTKKNINLSEKYLYWVTRRLLNWENKDSGAYLRTVMQALVRFGVCEEKFFKYDSKFKEEPNWVLSQLADDFQAETYLRLDKKGVIDTDKILSNIKKMIKRNYPIVFGFTVFTGTINNTTGEISYPTGTKKVSGGHAVVIVGYDDDKKIGNNTGALRIRNSWGSDWGEKGYGWLPYKYIFKDEANDFWTILRADWVNLLKFN